MKQNPLLSAIIVFPAAPAATSPNSLTCKLTGLPRGTVAIKKPLEQYLVEGTGSPPHDPD